ncbi:MAG: exodeoxyribonuclease VII small subunit [Clostridia bacterium]|nr:exodeoxyribonuclease VII small subunit [Clostridia bacterium]
MTKEQIENLTFEAALARLEETVHLLESGNVPLDDSLSLFEEGIALVKFCNNKLDAAEQKVVKIRLTGENSAVEEAMN